MRPLRILILTTCVVLALVAAAPSSAHAPGASDWTWTPALCKSNLKNWGVEIDDGRTFRAAFAFCGGMPECLYDRSDRRYFYDHFFVAMIDNNLVYRTMRLHVTGEDSFRVDKLQVHGRAKTTAELRKFQRDASAIVAGVSRETQATCTVEP